METVPQMISTKDLAYISDMFNWNYNAYKTINHYMQEVKQEEIKELLESIKDMHYNHLSYLISILNGDEEEYEIDEEETEENNLEEDENYMMNDGSDNYEG